MERKYLFWAASALTALLAACQADSPEMGDKASTSATEPYKTPGEVHFVSDEYGNVLRQLPPNVLKDIHARLLAEGKVAVAKELAARYDFITGEVKDLREADRAESYLKSQVTLKPETAPEAPAPGMQVLRPDELPADIQVPEELIESLGRAASEGSAQ